MTQFYVIEGRPLILEIVGHSTQSSTHLQQNLERQPNLHKKMEARYKTRSKKNDKIQDKVNKTRSKNKMRGMLDSTRNPAGTEPKRQQAPNIDMIETKRQESASVGNLK